MEEKKNNWLPIRCPHCGREYLMNEIFYPDDFCGKPANVIKDATGKVIYVDYKEDYEPAFTQHFTCEECDRPFIVEASISFKSKPEAEELDFSNPYVSLLD